MFWQRILSTGAGLLATCSYSTFWHGCQLTYHGWYWLESVVSNNLNAFSYFWGIVDEKNHLLCELIVFRCLTGLQGLIALLLAFFVLVLCVTRRIGGHLIPIFPICSWKKKSLKSYWRDRSWYFKRKFWKLFVMLAEGCYAWFGGVNLGILYSKHDKIRIVVVLVDFALCLKIGYMFSESWWYCMPPGALQIQ